MGRYKSEVCGLGRGDGQRSVYWARAINVIGYSGIGLSSCNGQVMGCENWARIWGLGLVECSVVGLRDGRPK